MNASILPRAVSILVVFILANLTKLQSQSLDNIGVTALESVTTNLNGSGIRISQVEADTSTNPPAFEVTPGNVGQKPGIFTYFSSEGSSNSFPNNVGADSAHADYVGSLIYGFFSSGSGIATNVAHVDNHEANFFVQVFENTRTGIFTVDLPTTNINDPVVNQSFIFTVGNTNIQVALDQAYDNYAAKYRTLFVSAVGNGGPVNAPGTSYNGIGVGDYGGSSSYGPTLDNGRAKPDITTPFADTSFSTPQISGGAVLLMQAGLRGDGGVDTNAAYDIRTVKALLLNGAVKPAGWRNVPPSPFDSRYGAGVMNILNSYEQLAGGKQDFIQTTAVPLGGAHPPAGGAGGVTALSGWDFNTNSSSTTSDTVNHYYFTITNPAAPESFAANATLVWNRQQNQSKINHLGLFLYNCANSNLVACSTSLVDNVQHLYIPQLPQARYDLQVWKAGGTPGGSIVSAAESYALAFQFVAPPTLRFSGGTGSALSWPVYPGGFGLESTTNLVSGAWSTNDLPAVEITNGSNVVFLSQTNQWQFFRLYSPIF